VRLRVLRFRVDQGARGGRPWRYVSRCGRFSLTRLDNVLSKDGAPHGWRVRMRGIYVAMVGSAREAMVRAERYVST
jgi:hypothetical protein